MASRIKRWTARSPFSLYLDDFGYALGIALYGQVILHVQAGTQINQACLPAFLKVLNALPKSSLTPIIAAQQKYEAGHQKRICCKKQPLCS
jgi:hypothetical protein